MSMRAAIAVTGVSLSVVVLEHVGRADTGQVEEPIPSSVPFPSGGALDLHLYDAIYQGRNTFTFEADLALEPVVTPDRSIVFTLDASGSARFPGTGCGGDPNHDGLVDTILDCEIAAVEETVAQMPDGRKSGRSRSSCSLRSVASPTSSRPADDRRGPFRGPTSTSTSCPT